VEPSGMTNAKLKSVVKTNRVQQRGVGLKSAELVIVQGGGKRYNPVNSRMTEVNWERFIGVEKERGGCHDNFKKKTRWGGGTGGWGGGCVTEGL